MKKTADNSMEIMMARCQYSTQNWQIYIYFFTYYTKNKPPINCYLNVLNK